ncbi:MAG: hypothetical protein JXB14_06065 [Candidatus Altiarchaeota archaeon]|nr:hypothetical protein [Candidatus Altiarchaeota archaeon]
MGVKEDIISRILYDMVGNEGIKVINSLDRPRTDLQIHELTKIPITKIRTTLNTLHKYNIVSYNSCRDEKKGWFKYTWELKPFSVETSIKNYTYTKIMKLKREFQEINQVDFFKCENGCLRIAFIEAYESNFRCSKCNGVLKPVSSIEESRAIKEEMEELKRVTELIGVPMITY